MSSSVAIPSHLVCVARAVFCCDQSTRAPPGGSGQRCKVGSGGRGVPKVSDPCNPPLEGAGAKPQSGKARFPRPVFRFLPWHRMPRLSRCCTCDSCATVLSRCRNLLSCVFDAVHVAASDQACQRSCTTLSMVMHAKTSQLGPNELVHVAVVTHD